MEELIWQPISMLPTFARLIDEELADAEEHSATLKQADDNPHALDNATVQRSIKVHTGQLEFLSVFERHLERWRQADPTPREREEIDRLKTQLGQLRSTLADILTLYNKLAQGTIEKVLAKSDMELGIEALLRGNK
jgi:hypothetical protein